MEVSTLLALLGGLGLGSILNTLISAWVTRSAKHSDRLFEQKKEAYLGLLSALHAAAVQPSDEASKAYALWQTKCNLFGSEEVSRFAQMIVDTNDSPRNERDTAFNGLLSAMRDDLKK